jgi:transposase InsO family protein
MAFGQEVLPMPWKETCPMDERLAFIADYRRRDSSMRALCRAYGISRKTGYKVLGRYHADGATGLGDRSRAPHRHPQALRAAVRTAILQLRGAHPYWGPRKLRARLQLSQPETRWPAASSIGQLLRQAGVTAARPRVLRAPPPPVTIGRAPNDVWTIDFKGWFRTRDARRCDPLTLVDDASRFLLRCVALAAPTGPHVQHCLVQAFREHGLPRVLRSDNGPPFGSSGGAGGLSRLGVWWIKLGVRPERIQPGHPEQNPRHERLHWTLKQETALPPRATRCAQQRAFDRFRHIYNHERPHEALGQRPPASVYVPSPRPYPAQLAAPEYPGSLIVRRVRHGGEIKWRGQLVFLSHALVGEPVALEEVADGCWHVSFGPLLLGCLHADATHLHPIE